MKLKDKFRKLKEEVKKIEEESKKFEEESKKFEEEFEKLEEESEKELEENMTDEDRSTLIGLQIGVITGSVIAALVLYHSQIRAFVNGLFSCS